MEDAVVKKVLDKLNVEYNNGAGDEINASCVFAPWEHEDGKDMNPSMSINTGGDDVLYHCFTCEESGRTLRSLAWKVYYKLRKDNPEEAEKVKKIVKFLMESSEDDLSDWSYSGPKDYSSDKPEDGTDVEVWDEQELEEFSTSLPVYLRERGMTLETAEKWDLRFDGHEKRIIFPVRRRDNELVGLVGRTVIGNSRKYKNYWGFRRRLFLYGEHLVDEEDEQIVVVEGPIDAIMFEQYGIRNTVATLGVSVSDNQKEKILDLCNEEKVIIAFDGDEKGREKGSELAEDLSNHARVSLVEFEDGEDPADVSKERANELVEDAVPELLFGVDDVT